MNIILLDPSAIVRSPLIAATFDLNSGEWVRLFRFIIAFLQSLLLIMEESTYHRPVTAQSAGSTSQLWHEM